MASQDTNPAVQDVQIAIPKSGISTTILTSAITTSLTTLGYDPHLIQRVSLLSNTNTHTTECTLPANLLTTPSPETTKSLASAADAALSSLFDCVHATGNRINSNEPVLLINALSALSSSQLHAITDAAASSLRDVHHIRPIRIYGGHFTLPTNTNTADFSISVLNVVNTDIGGPGMVQLLDMADWSEKGAVRREIWDGSGWNLVEREDRGDEAFQEVGVEGSDHSEVTSEAGDWESDDEEEKEVGDVKEETEETAGSEVHEDVEGNDASHDVLGDVDVANKPAESAPEDDEVEMPEEDPWSQRPQLRDIRHPSWEHTNDKESLLDMITKQSQRLPISKSGNAYATSAASKEKADLSGEDEYEVI